MSQLSPKKFKKALGERIRKVRKERGITLKAFESYEGSFDRHYLSRLESGEFMPTVFTLYRIANIFGVSTKDLLP
jgi:transcriptional regulator with XRE-family HTH domain